MRMIEYFRQKLTGEPSLKRNGREVVLTTSHRLPSSGHEEVLLLRILTAAGVVGVLVAHYRPETALPYSNVLVESANTVIVGLANAVGKLGEVVERQTLDLPLEDLRGWLVASAVVGSSAVFRHSGLFDLYTYLTNREHVTLTLDDEYLSIGRGLLRSPKRIARDEIQDVLILKNHRTGHDVMVQHKDGLTRVASVYGDLTRPTLLRARLLEALSQLAPMSAAVTA